jgi:hypothetical protein
LISPALPGIHRQNRGFYFFKRNLCQSHRDFAFNFFIYAFL